MKDYDRTIALNPSNWLAYMNRGNLFDILCEYRLAAENLSCAITLNPQSDRLYYERGAIFRRWGKLARSIEDYSQAIFFCSQDTVRAKICNDRGYVFFIKGEINRAIDDYNSAIALDPTLAFPYLNSGEAFVRLGEIESAISCYFQAAKHFQDLGEIAGCNRAIAALKKLSS